MAEIPKPVEFSPANMPQYRPDLAGKALNATVELELVSPPVQERPDAGIQDQPDAAVAVKPKTPQSPQILSNEDAQLVKHIRKVLGGGNPDLIGRKPSGRRSFRYI